MASEAHELNEPAGTGHARPGPARFWLANVRDLLGVLVGVLAAAAVIVAGINHATAGLDARMLSMESRFQEMDVRWNTRLQAMDIRWDDRLQAMESRWNARARTMEQRLREDIAGVREEVAGVREDVAGVRKDVAGVRKDVREDVAGVRGDVTQLGERLARVETIVGDIRNRQEPVAEVP